MEVGAYIWNYKDRLPWKYKKQKKKKEEGMKGALVFFVFVGFLVALAAPAEATVITFEDLNPGVTDSKPLSAGYGGFNWSLGATWYTKSYAIDNAPGSGLVSGVVGAVAVYGANTDHAISLEMAAPFKFLGAEITAKTNNPENITIEGWLGTAKIYSQVFSVNNSGPTAIVTSFNNIDRVVFLPTAVGQNAFALDNISYTGVTSVPLPPSVLLFGAGLFGLVGFRKLHG